MSDISKRVMDALKEDFGFDEFMAGQIFQCLRKRDLLDTEPLGDSYSKALDVLQNKCDMDLPDIYTTMQLLVDAGVVFRDR